MGLDLHYNVILEIFVATKTFATDGCPFMEFRWILVEEINFEYIISWMKYNTNCYSIDETYFIWNNMKLHPIISFIN
jgi:hypothetical protein